MPQIGKRYVVRLRVAANKEPLEYVERPTRDMAHSLLSSRRPDLCRHHLSVRKEETLDGPHHRNQRRRKTHASGSALGNGEAVALHEGFLHGQHEVRREALDDDGPRGRLEPPVWI